MEELFNNYSGLFAIAAYTLLFLLIINIRKLTGKKETEKEAMPLNPDDEYAMVASLMASIVHRKKTHKNVRVISVKEVS